MAYTAIDKMQKRNEEIFGRDVGPRQPALFTDGQNGLGLKSAALRFIHERCENLCFDRQIEAEESETGCYRGTSIAPNQIPYNMQMDINRLCLERELERFIDSGATQDAYNVYYCFMEIFFGSYGKSKRMVELLEEFEANGSALLMQHRDHYSHSVYVFVLGLAIYESNDNFRKAFNTFYHFNPDGNDPDNSHEAANFFLKYWGFTSLFHDIGYPFELTFEQIISYFESGDDMRGKNPFITYRNIESLTRLKPGTKKRFQQLYGRNFDTIDEVLAFDITQKLGKTYGFSEEYLLDILQKKTTKPENYAYYMDHAYFSALNLFLGLSDAYGLESQDSQPVDGSSAPRPDTFQRAHVDVLTAIALHYVVYRYSIAFSDEGTKPTLNMDLHPLAWLLILCDELQCWDRIAYGRNSKSELQPMSVEFDFSHNRLVARYMYDEAEQDKIDAYLWKYVAWKKAGKAGKAPRLKAYSDMADENKSFLCEINRLVNTAGIPITLVCDIAPVDRSSKHMYLSNSSFMHIYEFAQVMNACYSHEGHEEEVDTQTLENEFKKQSLEYKIFNINQVKSFSRYLDAIHCFYTDRPVDYDMLTEFTPEEIGRIAPMEHERWIREHQSMGWRYGDEYEHVPVPDGADERAWRKMLREQMRCHKNVMDGELTKAQIRSHFNDLPEKDKNKDWLPFNSMLRLIRKYDGLRIYRFAAHTDESDA